MKQVVVVTENKTGEVADISQALSGANINIDSIGADTVGRIGLIRIMVGDDDVVLKILRDKGYSAVTEEVLLVRLEDKPGALANVAVKFKDAHINITNLRLMERDGEYALTAITCDKMEEAKRVLSDVLVS